MVYHKNIRVSLNRLSQKYMIPFLFDNRNELPISNWYLYRERWIGKQLLFVPYLKVTKEAISLRQEEKEQNEERGDLRPKL